MGERMNDPILSGLARINLELGELLRSMRSNNVGGIYHAASYHDGRYCCALLFVDRTVRLSADDPADCIDLAARAAVRYAAEHRLSPEGWLARRAEERAAHERIDRLIRDSANELQPV